MRDRLSAARLHRINREEIETGKENVLKTRRYGRLDDPKSNVESAHPRMSKRNENATASVMIKATIS